MCEALIYLLDNIYIRFGTKLYRHIIGIPMGTYCAPLVADLFLFCYERDFMTSLSDVKQAEIIEAFKSTSRYLDDLLNIDNPVLPLTGFTFLNLFGLLECLVMWLISMPSNKSLTAKLLQQGYRYHKLRKTVSKFYRRHYELVSKFNVGLKTLLHQGLSEP